MMFFFQIYLKLCFSKRKEPPLKWEIDLWEEMMGHFDNRGLLLYPRGKILMFLSFFFEKKK